MVEENGAQNNLVLRNIKHNDTIHVPTGEFCIVCWSNSA